MTVTDLSIFAQRCEVVLRSNLLTAKEEDLPNGLQYQHRWYQEVRRVFSQLDRIDLTALHDNHLEILLPPSRNMLNTLDYLDSTSPHTTDAEVTNRADQFQSAFYPFIESIEPIIPIMLGYASKDDPFAAMRFVELVLEAKEKVDQILFDLQSGLTDRFVYENASLFKEQADEHRRHGARYRMWGCLIGYSLLAYGLAVNWYLIHYPHINGINVLPYALAHASVVAILVYGMSVCFRNHATHNHNDVVYRKQYNSLRTFKFIVDAAPDDQTKGAILQQLAASVFATQDSGYLSNGADTIIFSDVVKALSGK